MNENLTHQDAILKLRELVKRSSTCLFGTRPGQFPLHVCPMQVQQVDDAGDLWFFSSGDSEHNAHIQADPSTQLFFTNNSDYEYLVVSGTTAVVQDRAKTEELWDTSVEAWFPDGKDDPKITLLRLTPTDAHYWGTKNGKMISLIQMLGAAIRGKQPDVGVEGDLAVR